MGWGIYMAPYRSITLIRSAAVPDQEVALCDSAGWGVGGGERGAKWDTRTVGNDTGYDTSDFYTMVTSARIQGDVSF